MRRLLLYTEVNQKLKGSEAMPWEKGQSDNPGGLSKGSRRKLTDAFIRTLARDWEMHSEEVIKRVREESPLAYFKGLLSLLPKDVNLEARTEQPYREDLSATLTFIERVRGESQVQDTALVKYNPQAIE